MEYSIYSDRWDTEAELEEDAKWAEREQEFEQSQERIAFLSDPDFLSGNEEWAKGQACESGWTGDRCTFPLFHEGPHSND